jgi:NADPH-dependent glutamate synthase beta subunit-like oxidoreductase
MSVAPTTIGQTEREPAPASNGERRVIVVGAGPAGLASAAELDAGVSELSSSSRPQRWGGRGVGATTCYG